MLTKKMEGIGGGGVGGWGVGEVWGGWKHLMELRGQEDHRDEREELQGRITVTPSQF